MEVRYLSPARTELADATRHYAETSDKVAMEFLVEIEAAEHNLTAFPKGGGVFADLCDGSCFASSPTASFTSPTPTRS